MIAYCRMFENSNQIAHKSAPADASGIENWSTRRSIGVKGSFSSTIFFQPCVASTKIMSLNCWRSDQESLALILSVICAQYPL